MLLGWQVLRITDGMTDDEIVALRRRAPELRWVDSGRRH